MNGPRERIEAAVTKALTEGTPLDGLDPVTGVVHKYACVKAGDVVAVAAAVKTEDHNKVTRALAKGATGCRPEADVFQLADQLKALLAKAPAVIPTPDEAE